MANDYFFQHDYNPTNDPKIQAMYADHGDWGYGLFWRIIEALHRDENHRLPLKSYVFKAFAQHPSTSVEQVQSFVDDCINEYDLLLTDSDLFYSARVDRNIEKRSKISESRSAAGRASALAKQNATSFEQKSTKERKRKEKKEEVDSKAQAPAHSPEDTKAWESFESWVKEKAPRVSRMPEPLNITHFLSLRSKYGSKLLADTILQMQNYKGLDKKVSANLTIRKWATSELDRNADKNNGDYSGMTEREREELFKGLSQ